MAPLNNYTVQLKNLHKQYKLSQSVMSLFKALDEHRRGFDPDALGRLMRMSPGMRKACTDTISQLAKVMQKKQDPSTVAECTELIQNCTEILALASELAPSLEIHRKKAAVSCFPLSPPQFTYWLQSTETLLHPSRKIYIPIHLQANKNLCNR